MYNVYSADTETKKIRFHDSFDCLEEAIAYKMALRQRDDIYTSWIENAGSVQYSS